MNFARRVLGWLSVFVLGTACAWAQGVSTAQMGGVIRAEEHTEDADVDQPAPERATDVPPKTTMVKASTDEHTNEAENRARGADGDAIRTPKKTDDKSGDAGHKIKEDELRR